MACEEQTEPEPLWLPNPAFPGEQTMIYRNSNTPELVGFSLHPQRRVFRVRAVVTDQGQPLNSSLEEVLAFVPRNRMRMPSGPFSVWKHYGGEHAVFHDLCSDAEGNLSAIAVDVSAIRPELALGYARAAVNQLLDSLTATVPHPLVIQRLELMSPKDRKRVLAYQITMPHQFVSALGKFGGIGPNGYCSGVEAVLREAATNPSAHYRLMLAYRGHEGITRIRRELAAFVKKHAIQAPELTKIVLNTTEMAQHGLRGKVLTFDDLDQMVEHYREFRDAAAHFFVGGRGSRAQQHLQFSSTLAHTYARVSAIMLVHLRRELIHLKEYHGRHIAPISQLGMILPMEGARERYIVICPDDEATAQPDAFN